MKQLTVVYIIVISVCGYSLPATSIENVIQENTSRSCDVLLNFSNMGLSTVHPNFISNPYIKALALRNNSIINFQENTFDSLPSLEALDLSNNELTAESQNLFSFGSLNALKSLALDNNPNSLSAMIKSYSEREVDGRAYYNSDYDYRRNYGRNYGGCSENQYYTNNYGCKYFTELKVKYVYPNLIHLSIKNIFINSLASDWAIHFPKLSNLDMSENNFCTTSEKVFSHLPASVISLTMRNAGLTALETSKLKSLTHLDLNENKFDTVSSHSCYENTLCLRNFTNLKSLHIANCAIRKIETDAFKDLKNLNYLDMSSNDFVEIPEGTFEFLLALSHLNLSGNNLLFIPDFSNLQNLTSLYMDNIQNKELLSPYVLETFSQLPSLEILSLRFNGLTAIPSNFLDKLPKLRELNLSNNRITSLPSWQWQNSLCRLSLDKNEIENLEDISLKGAESLEFLNLENNKFTEIKLKSLKHLPDDVILKI